MAEALKMAKKNLGLKEGPPAGNGQQPKEDAMTQLEAAIELIDNVEAKELLQAKARQVKADLEVRASEAENRAANYKGKDGGGGHNAQDERNKLKLELTANAIQLLEKNVDPHIVATYILGNAGPQIPITLGQGNGNQGFTMNDILTLVDKIRPNTSPSAELAALQKTIDEMKAQLATLKPVAPTTPVDAVTAANNSLKSVNELVDNLVKAGMAVKPGTAGTNTGEPVDLVHERNRHDEEMEKIKETRDYHKGLVDTLQDTTERIGEGLAQRAELGGGGGEESAATVAKTSEKVGVKGKTFTCPDCKTTMPIYPETPDQVTCTKCGQIWGWKEKKVEVAQ